MSFDAILDTVNKYYTEKVNAFGATPKGVDWNGEESQFLRFEQLLKVMGPTGNQPFSILDYGCGFGSLYGYLTGRFPEFRYTGFDISEEMVNQAKSLFQSKDAQWVTKTEGIEKHDYVVASGIFNVRMQTPVHEWKAYIIETLDKMNSLATKGFSFNILTSYSDKEYMRDYLYYADPSFFFDYCKRNYSKYVALLHDYPLYEFSILVRKKEGNG